MSQNSIDTPPVRESAPAPDPKPLSPVGKAAVQGEVDDPPERSTANGDETGSLKSALTAGLAAAIVGASSLVLLDRIDFQAAPVPAEPAATESAVLRPAEVTSTANRFHLPAEGEATVQYHLPAGMEETQPQRSPSLEASDSAVPLYNQHDLVYGGRPTQYGCVPASVSMITEYWHAKDPANLTHTAQEYLDLNAKEGEFDTKGMSASAIHDELSTLGYVAADHVDATFEDLQKSTQVEPVLAVVKLNLKASGDNHAVVVTAIAPNGDVSINDPWTGRALTYTKDAFLKSWGANFGAGAPSHSYMTIHPAPK